MKSKTTAVVLAVLLGGVGAHNFYLGYTKRAVTQLILCLLFSWTMIVPIIILIWVVYEIVQIVSGKTVDANGNPLR